MANININTNINLKNQWAHNLKSTDVFSYFGRYLVDYWENSGGIVKREQEYTQMMMQVII